MVDLIPVDSQVINKLEKEIEGEIFSHANSRYKSEPRGKYQSTANFIAKPRNTKEISKIIKLANLIGFGVVPYAGGSGLVGGQISLSGHPLVLSLERINKVRSFDSVSGVINVEAGLILAQLKNICKDYGRLFPLTLASEGSCMIGGNLATNAGGVNVLKYGNARDLCFGLEAVLGDGRIYSDLKGLKKDNTGYDIKNLLIGSEGTLGIITAASLKTFSLTRNKAALVSVNSPSDAVELYEYLSSNLDLSLQAFELISRVGIEFLSSTGLMSSFPIAPSNGWLVLVEVGSKHEELLGDSFEVFLSDAMKRNLAKQVIISQNQKQFDYFWELRELIPEANRLIGSISNHDISLPLANLASFIQRASTEISQISDFLRINCFGHIGDGNLHFNVFPPVGKLKCEFECYEEIIREKINDLVVSLDGSISAEHGIGRFKREDMYKYTDPTKISLMKSIKDIFDPNSILNPGSIFLDSEPCN